MLYPNKIKIAVCGKAHAPFDEKVLKKAQSIGKEIARLGCIIISGATMGYPYEAAKSAKDAGGISVGVSPADGKSAHIHDYHLPLDAYDPIIYTGFGYQGRNVVLVRSADAVIFIGGGSGTLNEFTIAYRLGKPLGVLKGSGKLSSSIDVILDICSVSSEKPPFVHEEDPTTLVARIIEESREKIESV